MRSCELNLEDSAVGSGRLVTQFLKIDRSTVLGMGDFLSGKK